MNISEIAKLAGVSSSAVSRYLNHGYISDEKKEKIRAVIEKTGYQPSAQAQTLRTKVTKMAGIILPKINSESVSRMVSGISSVLSDAGYQILLADTENQVDKELEYLNLFQNNIVDGIIFIATILKKEHKAILKESRLPVVIVGQNLEGISCVYHDDFHAAKELTELMICKGSMVPALIGVTNKDMAAGFERKRGFVTALQKAGFPVKESFLLEKDFSMEAGYMGAKELFAKEQKIDAIFCATDTIAIGAMKFCRETGRKIPDQLQISGIGHTLLSEAVTPTLTTAHYYYKTCGMEAAKLLLGLIRKEEQVVKELKLGYQIIKQNSTK